MINLFKKYLAQVIHETARVGRIVQDLLAFSRRSKPQQRAHINLNAIITSTVTIISHKLKLMNVSMELKLNDKLPLIKCDASQMQQVLINLIMNGAEAAQTKPEGKVIVETGVSAKGDEIILDVSDNGDGIPPENIPKLFTPFFTTKGEGKGVGLGLAVVYGIVQGHSGDIEVKSNVGRGTSFKVTLPVEPEENTEDVPITTAGHVA